MSEPNKRRQAARAVLDHDPAKLRRRRVECGLGVLELAAKVDLKSASHISELERGNRNPSPGLLKRLAEALDCETRDLMPDCVPATVG